VGNYLLAEGLYKAMIDPFASIGEISDEQRGRLLGALYETAQASYQSQGVTLSSYKDTEGKEGKYQFELQCYGRNYDASPHKRPVMRETNGPHGRTIWYVKDQLFMPLDIRKRLHLNQEDDTFVSQTTNTESKKKKSSIINTLSKGSDTATSTDKSWSSDIEEEKHQENARGATPAAAAAELSSYLTDCSWKEALGGYMESSPTFRTLSHFVLAEDTSRLHGQENIYPPKHEIFQALNLTPLDDVKVVIVGQDPYHNPHQGHGLAFSVKHNVAIPPSLRNIYKEAAEDVGIVPPTRGCLEGWAKQGVLLLNAVLTVRSGEPNSHKAHGWEEFTDQVLQSIIEKRSPSRHPVVFLLWGAQAQKKVTQLQQTSSSSSGSSSSSSSDNHVVITTSHPSPLGATKTKSPFLGSRCFSRANAALELFGADPIDWNVTE
jgi:uracil-DNA glycosylase